MNTSRMRRALLAAAIGLVPAAVGGGTLAIASTPPPTPAGPATPTPTPVPDGGYTLCGDPTPQNANRPAYLAAYAKNSGTTVSLYWGFGTGAVYQGPCIKYPSQWKVYVDDVFAGNATGGFTGDYSVGGMHPGETHTFRVESVNNTNYWGPKSTTLTVTEADTPPTPAPVPPGGTPTPTLAPPTPTPTPTGPTPTPGMTPGPVLCSDPWAPDLSTPYGSPYDRFTNIAEHSVTFEWALFGCRNSLVGYRVLVNGEVYKTVNALVPWRATDELTGLSSGTTYTVEIVGFTGSGDLSLITRTVTTLPPDETGWFNTPTPTPTPGPVAPTPQVPTPKPPTPGPPTPLPITPFTAKGSLVLRAQGLSGTFAVSGAATISAPQTSPGGMYGTLPVFTSSGTLLVGGLLPIQATISTSAGKLYGLKDGATASLTTPYSLTIQKATFLGVTLTSGSTCKSSTFTLPLSNVGAFDRLLGGKLGGAFKPGAFSGCGALGQYLSAQPAKSSLTLTLTPQA